jgi:hypothetical protein
MKVEEIAQLLNPPPSLPRGTPMSDTQSKPTSADNVQSRPTEDTPGRGSDGKFAAGNQISRGNPFARQCAELRKALVNAVTPQDIAEIVAKLLEKAKAGDAAAARVLFSYALGKPAAAVDPDTINQQELQTLATNREDCDAAMRVVQLPPVELTLAMLHEAIPYMDRAKAVKIRDRFLASVQDEKEDDTEEAQGKEDAPQSLEEAMREHKAQREQIKKYLDDEPELKRSKKRRKPKHKVRKQPVLPVGGRFPPSTSGSNGQTVNGRGH